MIRVEVREADKCNGPQSAYVTFDFSYDIVNTIKSLNERYFDKDSKTWEMSLKDLSRMFVKLPQESYEMKWIQGETVQHTCTIPEEFKFKTKPFKHQEEFLAYAMEHDTFLLGDGMGAGKTKQAIDLAVCRKLQGVKHCLIVCGVNGLKYNWVQEIKVHSDEEGYILGTRYRKNGKMIIGSTKDKLDDLMRADLPYFIITNIETLRDKDINTEMKRLCNENTIGMCVVDEMHKCSNTTSQQGKGLLKVMPKYRLAMTGTPLMNKPLDLYGILKWLGYENHSLYAFKNHYCIMGGYGGYQIMGYKNLEEIESTLSEMMLRRLKKDILDLPEKLNTVEYVEMDKDQERIYKECLEEVQENIDLVKKAVNPLSELIRLRQATGWSGLLSSTVQKSAKMDRMLELVSEVKDNNDQCLVFSNWSAVTEVAVQLLKKQGLKVNTITGKTDANERQQIVNDFQDGKYDVLVGTIGAMGTGLTLTKAHTVIFLDNAWTFANHDQACDRAHRIGQTESVTIINLITEGTIDEKIYKLMMKKGKMSDAVIDGNYTEESLQQAIDYLLS